MAQYDCKIKSTELVELLSNNEGMTNLVSSIVNQILEQEMTEYIGVDKHQHSTDRPDYRNGYRVRQLYTRVGKLTLRVPQTRTGDFSTEVFNRYQRNEQALVSTLMDMYVHGVSTRKVTKITETLCGTKFSKSTVSRICTSLDAKVAAWNNRALDDKEYPFVIVDALTTDIRRDGAVRCSGVLIAYGINGDGVREILGMLVADSETNASWNELFKSLKSRGLKKVDLIVSDNHGGLVSALKKNFQGVQWQRCQTHFIRNILGHTPRHCRKEIAGELKLIFTAPTKETAIKLSKETINRFESKAPKAMDCLESGLEDALAIMTLPDKYRKKLRTSNMAERVNEEIRRREIIIRVFPNDGSAKRLIGSILADINDDWREANRYFDMTDYLDYKKESLESEQNSNNNVVAINE